MFVLHPGQVVRVARERTRQGLSKAWFRMWRYSTWVAARSATVAKPVVPRPVDTARKQVKGTRDPTAVEDELPWPTTACASDRRQQGIRIVRQYASVYSLQPMYQASAIGVWQQPRKKHVAQLQSLPTGENPDDVGCF